MHWSISVPAGQQGKGEEIEGMNEFPVQEHSPLQHLSLNPLNYVKERFQLNLTDAVAL